jgi:addiction module HigA family antidote
MTKLLPMHNPPHPGQFIAEVYLAAGGMSGRQLAGKLGVSPSTLQRVLTGSNGVSPEMALRLSVVLGRSPESWLAMQDSYALWHARGSLDLSPLEPISTN